MKWIALSVVAVTLLVARPAHGARLLLLDQTLSAPTPDTAAPTTYPPMPVGNRVGAVLLSAWAGSAINMTFELLPLMVFLVVDALSHSESPFVSMPLYGQVELSLGLTFIQSLAGTAAIWGITRALGGHPSFLTTWGVSAATRILICTIAIAAGNANGGWAWGTFVFAPLLGLTAEIITAQFDEAPPRWEKVQLPQPPASGPGPTTSARTVVFPVLARSF